MLKTKFMSQLSMLGITLFVLTSSSVFAANQNRDMKTIATDQMKIFEQEDEKQMFTDHGFTRGDMSYLYDGEFDPKLIENVSGNVTQVLRVQYPDTDCYLVAILSTQANNGKIAVNLGPVWFVEENQIKINEGDSIQVTGAKMRTNGRFIVIATDVSKNGSSLSMRDKEGTPLWGSPKCQKGDAQCMKKCESNKKK